MLRWCRYLRIAYVTSLYFCGTVPDAAADLCQSDCIVQGSGIGPTLYIVMKSDLHLVSSVVVVVVGRFWNQIIYSYDTIYVSIGFNRFKKNIKFADDTIILVPENTDAGLDVEFRIDVSNWADINRLMLNTGKTKEIVFRRPKVKYFHYATCYWLYWTGWLL